MISSLYSCYYIIITATFTKINQMPTIAQQSGKPIIRILLFNSYNCKGLEW